MSKKFLKLLAVAGTITITLLGEAEKLNAMWNTKIVELLEEDVKSNIVLPFRSHFHIYGEEIPVRRNPISAQSRHESLKRELALAEEWRQNVVTKPYLEEIIKDAPKANHVEDLAHQLEAQKNEIQSILLANQVLQNRVQELEQLEQQKRIRKEAKEQFQRDKWSIMRKTLGYGGTAIGIGLLSWYGYNGI